MKNFFKISFAVIFCLSIASMSHADEQSQANQPDEKKRWTLALSVGYEYDDNVLALPTELLKTTDVTTASDSRAVLTFNGGYKIIDKAGLSITPSYFLYQSLHKKLSSQDIQHHLASVTTNYQIKSTTIGLQYGYSYIYLDNKSLNAAHMLTPSLGIFLSPKLYSYLTYEYHDRKSFRDKNENAKVNAGSITQFFYPTENYNGWLNIGYKYNAENAVNNQYDFAENIFTAGGQIPLFEKLIFTPAVNYTEKEFKENYTGQTVKRKDKITNSSATLAREIVKNIKLSAGYAYTNNESNISGFDYKRNVYSLTLTANF